MPHPIREPSVETLAAHIATLEDELRGVCARVSALEAGRVATPAAEPAPAVNTPARVASVEAGWHAPFRDETWPSAAVLLGLAGRTLLVLAGAFMIRAVTDAGALPLPAGVALGLAYAALWIVLADREAAAGRRVGAVFQGVAGGLIAYPLLWEVATRFQVVATDWVLVALVAVFAGALAVARRRELGALAAIQTTLALGTAAGLLFATRELTAVAWALLAVAVLVEALAWRGRWVGLRWPAALTLDGALFVLVWLGGRPQGLPEGYPPLRPDAAVAVALLLPALYLVGLFVRTLRWGLAVVPFEVAQGAAALAIGLAGAERLLVAQGAAPTVLGIVTLLLGAACYAAAFAFVERRRGRGRNFYFYSTAAGLLTLVGTRAVLAVPAAALAWMLLALGAAWCARRFGRLALGYHAAFYLVAATAGAGLFETCRRCLLGAADGAPWPRPLGWLAVAVAAGVYALLLPARAEAPAAGGASSWWRRVPQALTVAILVLVASAVLVALLAAAVEPSPVLRPAVLATLRTAVLAALATALAFLGRRFALRELTWLVHPLLLVGGLKLLVEDLPAGRPATLVLSFLFYGGALLTAPRLVRPRGDGQP